MPGNYVGGMTMKIHDFNRDIFLNKREGRRKVFFQGLHDFGMHPFYSDRKMLAGTVVTVGLTGFTRFKCSGFMFR